MSNQPNQQEINDTEWLDSANWRYGIFYFSEKDTRSWVPKRSMLGRRRYGGTPNFAKDSARKFMMVVAGACVVIFLVVVSLENSLR